MDPERFEVCKPFLTTKDIKVILVRGDKSLAESISPPAELFSDVVARGKDKKIPKVPMDSEDEAMIMYTSGFEEYLFFFYYSFFYYLQFFFHLFFFLFFFHLEQIIPLFLFLKRNFPFLLKCEK